MDTSPLGPGDGEPDTPRSPVLATVGETMAAFIRSAEPDRYLLTPVGAESNVAAGMAQLGCRTQWWSRLGDDELGRFVRDVLTGHGVEVVADRDAERLTGSCVREMGPNGSRMRYYRAGSAASRLDLLDVAPLLAVPRVHITGVTPALSDADRALVERLVRQRQGAAHTSFDVNYRPVLWESAEHAASVLLPLARAADVVFIGDDEAQALLGTTDLDALAGSLVARDGQELVLKRGAGEATVVAHDGCTSAPASRVTVVDLTGAGDAFAAGYLAASVWGWRAEGRLRLGHYLAARVVAVIGDIGPPVARAELHRLADSVRETVPERVEEFQG